MALLGRDTSITGLPDVLLLLETFEGKEVLGKPYNYSLSLLSADGNIPIEKVLGQALTISIKLDSGAHRYFHGVVTYFAKTGISLHHTRYHAVLSPTLAKFASTRDSRVFNKSATSSQTDVEDEAANVGQTALTIVTDVLADRGLTELDADSVKAHAYRKRKYCVQYRESDLNFVHRLLEEEGIYYFFKHDDGKHTMVLADSVSAHATVPGYEVVSYFPKERKHREAEHFWSLEVSGELYPSAYTVLRGYDYTKKRPKSPQFGDAPSEDTMAGPDFEDYDYPGGLSEESEAKDEAAVRTQTDRVASTVIEAAGNTMGLGVGALVSIKKPLSLNADFNPFWREDDFDKEYLVTAASYSISVNQYETGDVAQSDEPFKARYLLLDSNIQYRPRRDTVKPRIEGPQTAMVVGPSGQEIWTDKLGRVLVQFDWDRLGERNEKSSCWVRVGQMWAGTQWGAIHIPRIGQEVIVEFMDGDPDRPIITGRVYNADNLPPYTLPDNKTQSGIKTRSSKDGTASNFNEIRFEDLKGKEELHIQAELDMSTNVKRNQTLYVGGDQNITIHGNQTTSVHGTDEKTGKKLPVQSVTTVTGKHTFDASDTIKIQAPTSITLECGGSTIVMVPGKITLTAGGGATIVLDANVLAQSNPGAKVLLDANVLAQSLPGAKVVLDANVLARSVPGAQVVLDANVAAKSVPGSELTLDASATLSGTASATVQGKADATLTAGGGTVKTSSAGVAASGPKVDIAGSGMVSIAGGIVKIN